MGPQRDVVGDWQKAAQKYGLRFGVSEHLGASFTWFQSSHRADKAGPKAGVPYDGADPKYEDLYHFPAEPKDTGWYSNNPKWHKQWFNCITDLIDNYNLDLLYTDGGVPFANEAGMSMIAHLYNTDIKNRGQLEVVYNCKQGSEGRWVEDLERGVMPRINPTPWQTDTSIGDWYYNKNWKFRPVSWEIQMLVDIVSKNGNLLLNVVQRPDGSLDAEVEQMLGDLAAWNEVNGEAIFGTRPWLVYGEGATRARGGHFNEDYKYSAKDIRFTTKGAALYAIALGRPIDGQIVIRSLAKPADGGNAIQKVSLVGSDAALEFKQTADALIVTIPETKGIEAAPAKAWNCTTALKITGTDLKAVPFAQVIEAIGPDRKGIFKLDADSAELHGKLQVEHKGVPSNIGFWDSAADWVSWKVKLDKAGSYQVSASCAATSESEFVVEAAGQQLVGKVPKTGDWGKFQRFDVGRIEIKQPGEQVVKVRPHDPKTWRAINLAEIVLKPAK